MSTPLTLAAFATLFLLAFIVTRHYNIMYLREKAKRTKLRNVKVLFSPKRNDSTLSSLLYAKTAEVASLAPMLSMSQWLWDEDAKRYLSYYDALRYLATQERAKVSLLLEEANRQMAAYSKQQAKNMKGEK